MEMFMIFSWGSPVGVGIFFVGLGIFFWGLFWGLAALTKAKNTTESKK